MVIETIVESKKRDSRSKSIADSNVNIGFSISPNVQDCCKAGDPLQNPTSITHSASCASEGGLFEL
jgi:hypothetical protein